MVIVSDRRTWRRPRHSAGPSRSARLLMALLVGVLAGVALVVVTLLLPRSDSSGSGQRAAPPSAAPRPTSATPTITLDPPRDVADPMTPVRLTGTVRGVPERSRLTVQTSTGAGGWMSFPLQPVLDGNGRFRTFVELGGSGDHRLRVVDPGSGTSSAVVVVRVR